MQHLISICTQFQLLFIVYYDDYIAVIVSPIILNNVESVIFSLCFIDQCAVITHSVMYFSFSCKTNS
jgi:hypothetical protein